MTTEQVHAQILETVEAHRDQIIEFVQDLVRIPSVNYPPHGDELACQRLVEGFMRNMALDVDIFKPDAIPGITEHPGWMRGHDYADRPNVVGVRQGAGGGRSLLLLAHVDVVPEGPHELWRYGPFTPKVEKDELIGRGSNDDKGGLAALLMALRCVEAAGYRTAGNVILASVVDEESGAGNGTLATLLRGHIADGAVYCDGLNLEIHVANLGGGHCLVDLQLRPEVSTSRGIERIVEILSIMYQDICLFGQDRARLFQTDPRYRNTQWPKIAVRAAMLSAGTSDGSNSGNARIQFSFYILPGEDPAMIQAEVATRIRSLANRYDSVLLPPRIQWPGRLMPPSAIAADHPFVDMVAAAYAAATQRAARRSGSPMSDLFQFNLFSPRPMPTVAMGPGRWGDSGAAHEPNESVLIDGHLIPFVKTLALLIVDWCGCVPATSP